MNLTCYKLCLFLLGALAIVTTPVSARNVESRDSNGSFSETVGLTKNSKQNSKAKAREYTFKAPDSKVIANPEQLTKVQGYRVEVYGSDRDLLQQVKEIEPGAFIKEDRIQVGIFSQQINAEDLVRKLARKGLWSRIVEQ